MNLKKPALLLTTASEFPFCTNLLRCSIYRMTMEIPRSTEALPIGEWTMNSLPGNKNFGGKQESVHKIFLSNNAISIHVSSQALSNHMENSYLAHFKSIGMLSCRSWKSKRLNVSRNTWLQSYKRHFLKITITCNHCLFSFISWRCERRNQLHPE